MRFLVSIGLGAVLSTLSPVTNAASIFSIDFESAGIANSTFPSAPIGFNVSGYHFSNSVAVLDVSSGTPLSNFGPAHSGKYLAVNDYYAAGDISITRTNGSTFDFYGLSLLNSIYSPLGYVIISGYKAGVLQNDFAILTGGSQQWDDVSVSMRGVDQIKIYRLSGGAVFFDDVRVSAVPELPALPMLFSGFGVLALIRKRFISQAGPAQA